MSSLIPRGSLFDDFFRDVTPGFFIKPLHGDPFPAASQIKIDVKENEKNYTVYAELPGVGKDDIHVSIDANVVTLRAEIRQEDSSASGQKILRSERYFGEVTRSFQLPQEIDSAEASAKYENGVLNLTLPKKQIAGGVKKLRID